MKLTRKQLRRLIESSTAQGDHKRYFEITGHIGSALDKLETLLPGELDPVDVRELRLLASGLLHALERVGDEAQRHKQETDPWRQP